MITKRELNKLLHDFKRISIIIKNAGDDLKCTQNDLNLLKLECDKLYEDLAELKKEKK